MGSSGESGAKAPNREEPQTHITVAMYRERAASLTVTGQTGKEGGLLRDGLHGHDRELKDPWSRVLQVHRTWDLQDHQNLVHQSRVLQDHWIIDQ